MDKLQSSIQQQELIVSTFLKGKSKCNFYAQVHSELSDEYFTDPKCKMIYKAVQSFYTRYRTAPTYAEASAFLDSVYIPSYGVALEDVRRKAELLVSIEDPEPDSIKDVLEKFIKDFRMRTQFQELISQIKNNPNGEIPESTYRKFMESLNVDLSTEVAVPITVDTFIKARSEALGEGNLAIKSFMPGINNIMSEGGLVKGSLNMVVGPPGCFTGDTKLMNFEDGKTYTMEELYNSKSKLPLYGCKTSTSGKKQKRLITTPTVGYADSIYLSAYTKDLVEVEIDGKYTIKCTPDHPFMLRNGEYKQAKDLTIDESLMPLNKEFKPLFSTDTKTYEYVSTGSKGVYTHKLVADTFIERDINSEIIHHINRNRFDNSPENLMRLTKSQHSKIHSDLLISVGKNTRYDNEDFRKYCKDRYRERLKNDPELREKISQISKKNGQNSKLVKSLNFSKEFQDSTKKNKVLKGINRLISMYGIENISYDNFSQLSKKSNLTYKPRLKGIESVFGKEYTKNNFNDILYQAKMYNHRVTKVTFITLDKEVPVYGVVEAKPNNNYAIALSDTEGVIVSNTGKSMFLFNEGCHALRQGYKVLHVLIGDLTEYDGMTRYISCMAQYLHRNLSCITREKLDNIINIVNDQYDNAFNNLRIVTYPSYTLKPDQLIDHIQRFQRLENIYFDMIIIDYPDNLVKPGNSLYEDGGVIYGYLEKLAKETKTVVYVASQPKVEYYNEEIIPLAGAAESTRKQQAVDAMFCFNTHARNARFGSLFCAKTRRGSGTGRIIRWKGDFEKCNITEITEEEYREEVKAYNSSDLKLPDVQNNSNGRKRNN